MFDPHHRFAHCVKIERVIADLKVRGSVTDLVLQNHNRYHYALVHKLKSARDHAADLGKILKETAPEDIVTNSADFLYKVNVSIDGFFYTGGSALDILAREVLTYFGISLPARVYYQTAEEQLKALRSGDPIITRLAVPTWKQEFSNYRNALTHELLIAGSYSINVEVEGATQYSTIVFPLPDDPRAEPPLRTFRKNKNVLKYCDDTFKRLLSHINKIYGDLSQRIVAHGALPL